MKTVFFLLDSLNRHLLSPYGGTRIATPNFDRLANRSVTFDKHYIGSMPCLPARRDLLTGRQGFLHRSWGPIEPFDTCFTEVLGAKTGTCSHLITDHFHYWEDGGATYHNRYDSYEFIRGQEGDPWKAMVQPPWERLREQYHHTQFSTERGNYKAQNIVNRDSIREESDFPSVQVVAAGIEFLQQHGRSDNWLLQIETFDPHEPFHAPERFKQAFDTGWEGPVLDWPRYGRLEDLPEECDELRANYYATVALCDDLLGRVLDEFDAQNLWEDTALVVTTDHGFLLGEHDFWAKNRQNIYEEIAHIPLFVYDPRRTDKAGSRCNGLTQTADLAATFLHLHDTEVPERMASNSLLALIDGLPSRRGACLYGYFGGAVNVTNGLHTYHRFPADLARQEIYQYTLMPTHIFNFFTTEELAAADLVDTGEYSHGTPVLKVPVIDRSPMYNVYGPGALLEDETRLYCLTSDPGQTMPVNDRDVENCMIASMKRLMSDMSAPPEAYLRLFPESESETSKESG